MIDVDGLKPINDDCGHRTGDEFAVILGELKDSDNLVELIECADMYMHETKRTKKYQKEYASLANAKKIKTYQ